MRTRFVVSLILPAALSSAALANETYEFDQSHSTIGFKVHQFLGTTNGRFTKFSGEIDIDREHPEKSSVSAKIDVRSIDTRIQKRDDHLRSAEFFNVAKFPEITFKSRSVTRTGPQSGDILGDLHHARRDETHYAACEIAQPTVERHETNALGCYNRTAQAP